MKLAIIDDDGRIIVAMGPGKELPRLERDLVGPLAEYIADEIGIIRKERIRKRVEALILDYFRQLKRETVAIPSTVR